MTRLLLVRHGAVDADGRCYGQRVEVCLSAVGHREVAALRRRLPSPTAAVRSPARRAAETAAALGLEDAVVDDRLAERDFGVWEGRTWEQVWAETPAAVATDPAAYAAHVPDGAEALADVADRVVAALEDLVAAHPDGTLVVVTHGGPVRAAVAHVLGLDPVASLRLQPATGSLTSLTRWASGAWTIDRLGAREEHTWD